MLIARDVPGLQEAKSSRPRIILLEMKYLVVIQLVFRLGGMMCHSMTQTWMTCWTAVKMIYISMKISNNKVSFWNLTSIKMMFPLFLINMSTCSLPCKPFIRFENDLIGFCFKYWDLYNTGIWIILSAWKIRYDHLHNDLALLLVQLVHLLHVDELVLL